MKVRALPEALITTLTPQPFRGDDVWRTVSRGNYDLKIIVDKLVIRLMAGHFCLIVISDEKMWVRIPLGNISSYKEQVTNMMQVKPCHVTPFEGLRAKAYENKQPKYN